MIIAVHDGKQEVPSSNIVPVLPLYQHFKLGIVQVACIATQPRIKGLKPYFLVFSAVHGGKQEVPSSILVPVLTSYQHFKLGIVQVEQYCDPSKYIRVQNHIFWYSLFSCLGKLPTPIRSSTPWLFEIKTLFLVRFSVK